jgi:hypothetical protein
LGVFDSGGSVDLEQIGPFLFGAMFLAVIAFMARGFFKHGGFKGMMFGARIRRTVGEVEGARTSMMRAGLKVHALDGGPEKAVGVELVARSMASYQMMPVALSVPEARKLIAHLQAALDVR